MPEGSKSLTGRPPKRSVDWFPHDGHASDNSKTIAILENHFGSDGYAVWFRLQERLSTADNHIITCRNGEEMEFLAAKLKLTPGRFEAILGKMAELDAIDRDLWEQNHTIWCQSLVDDLKPVYTNRRQDPPTKPAVITTDKPISTTDKPLSRTERPVSTGGESPPPKSTLPITLPPPGSRGSRGSLPTSNEVGPHPKQIVESPADSTQGDASSVCGGEPLPVKPKGEDGRGGVTPAKKQKVSEAEKGADLKKVSGAEKGADSKESDVKRVFQAVRDFYGFPDKYPKDPIPTYGKEGAAIKRILSRGFSVEEIIRCWKTKVDAKGGNFVPFAYVNEDIGKERSGTGPVKRATAHQRVAPEFRNYEEANKRWLDEQSRDPG